MTTRKVNPFWPVINNSPYWIYRQITLTAGDDRETQSFHVEPFGRGWLLTSAFMQFPAVGAQLPTTWPDIQIQLTDLGGSNNSNQLSRIPLPIKCLTTPGAFNNFNSGDPRNQASRENKQIDKFFHAKQAFQLTFSNFQNFGTDIVLDLLLLGKTIWKRPLE